MWIRIKQTFPTLYSHAMRVCYDCVLGSTFLFSVHCNICGRLLAWYTQTAIKFGRNFGLCDTVLRRSLASCIDDVRLNFNDAFRGIGQHAFLSRPSLHIFAIDNNFIREAGNIFLFVFVYRNILYTIHGVLFYSSAQCYDI
jgi:hypothetical protein